MRAIARAFGVAACLVVLGCPQAWAARAYIPVQPDGEVV
jgi:hypothetical protein